MNFELYALNLISSIPEHDPDYWRREIRRPKIPRKSQALHLIFGNFYVQKGTLIHTNSSSQKEVNLAIMQGRLLEMIVLDDMNYNEARIVFKSVKLMEHLIRAYLLPRFNQPVELKALMNLQVPIEIDYSKVTKKRKCIESLAPPRSAAEERKIQIQNLKFQQIYKVQEQQTEVEPLIKKEVEPLIEKEVEPLIEKEVEPSIKNDKPFALQSILDIDPSILFRPTRKTRPGWYKPDKVAKESKPSKVKVEQPNQKPEKAKPLAQASVNNTSTVTQNVTQNVPQPSVKEETLTNNKSKVEDKSVKLEINKSCDISISQFEQEMEEIISRKTTNHKLISLYESKRNELQRARYLYDTEQFSASEQKLLISKMEKCRIFMKRLEKIKCIQILAWRYRRRELVKKEIMENTPIDTSKIKLERPDVKRSNHIHYHSCIEYTDEQIQERLNKIRLQRSQN